jgi:quercetin dioxygenase-like cupin family protein
MLDLQPSIPEDYDPMRQLILREENMQLIRRECLWLFGLTATAWSFPNSARIQAYAQGGPNLTQILRQDLEGQDHMVQETIASIVKFPTGSAAPWHMHPSAQELLYVIEGVLTVEIEGRGKTLLKEGEATIIPADLVHLARNESTTAPGEALVMHSRAAKDKPLMVVKT